MFLGFIANEGTGSTEPGYPYLSCFPDIYSNVSIFPTYIPAVRPHLIGSYFIACNAIDNHNRMSKCDIAL